MNSLQTLIHLHTTSLHTGPSRWDTLAFSALPDAPVQPLRPTRRSVVAVARALAAARLPRRRVTCTAATPTRMAA